MTLIVTTELERPRVGSILFLLLVSKVLGIPTSGEQCDNAPDERERAA